MTYAIVVISIISLLVVARIVLLSREIDTLSAASAKYLTLVRSSSQAGSNPSSGQSLDSQETLIEYLWLKNAVDEKKESRTMWFGAAFILLLCLTITVVSNTS